MLEDRLDGVGISVERILEGTDVRRVDGGKKLLLQGVDGFVVGDELFEFAVVRGVGTSDLIRVRAGGIVWSLAWVRGHSPIVGVAADRGRIGQEVVGVDADDDDDMAKEAVTADGVDGNGIGHELRSTLLDRKIRWGAVDACQFWMRKRRQGRSGVRRGHVDVEMEYKRGGWWVEEPLDSIISIVC